MSPPPKSPPQARVLIVEDSAVFREMQTLLVGNAGFAVSAHENPQTALTEAAKQHFDLVIIDYELPEMNGEQFMLALRKIQPDIAVVFVSGSLTIELAIKLSSQNVAGIFNKPANPKLLIEKINETLARNAVRDTAARTGSASATGSRPQSATFTTASPPPVSGLAYTPRFIDGSSDPFREFSHRLWKVRDFRAVLLLQGEPGSPFEHFARELTEISIFRDGPTMFCEAAEFEPRRLIEVLAPSLLSHDAGTLIVTDVETLDANQQKTLLNLTTGRDVFLPFARKFRLVLAATSKLTERVDSGDFDETLFYKISSLSVTVPSLREMRGDIVTNATRILVQLGETNGNTPTGFTAEAAEWIEAQDWPGNYDQLAYILQLAVRHADGPEITIDALEAAVNEDIEVPEPTSRRPAVSTGNSPGRSTRPPFPIASDLAKEAAAEVKASGAVKAASPTGTPRVLAAASLFRPASSSYNFTQRLNEALSAAGAAASR
jgi:two-component system NtrC family response regulator